MSNPYDAGRSGSAPVAPDPDNTPSPYAPPYGSTPAYGHGGYGADYDAPAPGPSYDGAETISTGEPTPGAYGEPVAGGATTQVLERPDVRPGRAGAGRRRAGLAALLVAACLGSGITGAAVTRAFDDDPTTAAAAPTTASITRGTSAPAPTTAGTPAAAAATISPSVVTIAVTGTQAATSGFGSRAQEVSGTGSGIVLDTNGYIVTNNHVVSAAVSGGTVSVTFSDGTTTPAKIVGTDATSDLAVVKVDGRQGLTAATFADSDKLVVGQAVLAVGAPLGLSNTVTEGIVSTLHRPVRTGEAGASEQSVIDAVQTDAAINPGNSGGALVNLAGEVVGVNSAIASTGDTSSGAQSGNIGVGFAIPSNDVAEVSKELIDSGKATHPQIGISVGDAPGEATGTPGGGAVVEAVTAGGPAAVAGLQQGDVITKVEDRSVTDADSLIVAVRAHDPGDKVTVTYQRGGSTSTATITLAEAPTR